MVFVVYLKPQRGGKIMFFPNENNKALGSWVFLGTYVFSYVNKCKWKSEILQFN